MRGIQLWSYKHIQRLLIDSIIRRVEVSKVECIKGRKERQSNY